MQAIDLNNPSDRKKLFLALGLGIAALIFLWWTLFGFGGNSKPKAPATTTRTTTPSRVAASQPQVQSASELRQDPLTEFRPIEYQISAYSAPEARRNIFAYYEPPPPPLKPVPSPSPIPTPPVLLAGLSPSNVFARTGDFTLEISGDKFTSALRVVIDGREMPTRYVGPQQLSTTVPASIIANPGGRQVALRSPDGTLYSNPATLNVSPPPTPNFNYVGIIGTRRHLDIALLQDKNSKEILNVQRGDLLAGRFRVTSISEKEVVLVDTNLKIKHTLPFTESPERASSPTLRPTPKTSDDDEP
jgi:hypothetical protein